MSNGVIKFFDSDKSEFVIIENIDTKKLMILDTKEINLPIDYLTTGDRIKFKAQLSPFGPVAEEIIKI